MTTTTMSPTTAQPAVVAIVVYPGVQSLDVTGPAEVFAGANSVLRELGRPPAYDVRIVSVDGGTVQTESAVRLASDDMTALGSGVHTVLVPGGLDGGAAAATDPVLQPALGQLITASQRLITVCTGALVVAPLGVLDGLRVATHWARADRLARRHPHIDVDHDAIYHRADRTDQLPHEVWTSAGVTAGIDACLAVVEADLGNEIAHTIARWLVMFLRRPGGQSQFAASAWLRATPESAIGTAQQYAIDNPDGDLRIGVLAARVGMSERHFVRSFRRDVGMSPGQWISRLRVDMARHLLESTDDSITVIARRCGFGTAETMRRTLQRTIGVAPDHYRRRFASRPTSH